MGRAQFLDHKGVFDLILTPAQEEEAEPYKPSQLGQAPLQKLVQKGKRHWKAQSFAAWTDSNLGQKDTIAVM